MKKFEKLYNQLYTEGSEAPKEPKCRITVDGKYVESILGSNPSYMKFIMTEDKSESIIFSAEDAEKYRKILIEQGSDKILVVHDNE